MLDSASMTILGATGPNSSTIAQKNNTKNLENNDILDLADQTRLLGLVGGDQTRFNDQLGP